jgi:hypothetical protein
MSNGDTGGGGFPPVGGVPEGPSFSDKPGKCDVTVFRDNVIGQRASELFDEMHEFFKCKTAGAWAEGLLAGAGGVLFWVAGKVACMALAPLAKVVATAGTAVLEALGETRKEAAPDLNKLTIATMRDGCARALEPQHRYAAAAGRAGGEESARWGDD